MAGNSRTIVHEACKGAQLNPREASSEVVRRPGELDGRTPVGYIYRVRGADADTSRARSDGRREILVADHDRDTREDTLALLSRAGYGVRAAATGAEALEAAQDNHVDLALLEVELPSLSGYEVCRKLRTQYGERLPIIFLSADRTESFDRVAGLLLGADDYVVKPFAPDELLARVRGLLRPWRRGPDGDGDGATLTHREGEVLELVGHGLSDREIGRELVISPKTASTHVEHILGKLGAHTRAQAIAEAYRRGLIDLS